MEAVPPALQREIGRFSEGLAAAERRVEQHREAIVQQRIEDASQSMFSAAGLAIAFGPMLVLAVAQQLLDAAGLIPAHARSTVDAAVQLSSAVLMVVGAAAYAARRRRRALAPLAREASAAGGAATCSECGGLSAFAAGVAGGACDYCGTALIAPQRLLDEGLSQAERAERRARLERYREQRASSLDLIDRWRVPLDHAIRLLLVLQCLVAGYFVPLLLVHGEPSIARHGNAVTMGGRIVGVLAAVGVAAWAVRRIDKRRRSLAAVAALAERLGGAHLDTKDMLRWLDEHWAGPLNADLHVGGFGGVVASRIDGFAVLAIVDPAAWDDQHSPSVQLLVAAVWRQPPERLEEPENGWIRSQGFVPRINEGGLVASAGSQTMEVLHQQPARVLQLVDVLRALVRSLARLRAKPT